MVGQMLRWRRGDTFGGGGGGIDNTLGFMASRTLICDDQDSVSRVVEVRVWKTALKRWAGQLGGKQLTYYTTFTSADIEA